MIKPTIWKHAESTCAEIIYSSLRPIEYMKLLLFFPIYTYRQVLFHYSNVDKNNKTIRVGVLFTNFVFISYNISCCFVMLQERILKEIFNPL